MTDHGELASNYLILIEGGPPSNYSAWSPDLPGCVATGDTLGEVEREMQEAIVFHLEGLAEEGAPVPEPSGPGVYVERKKRPQPDGHGASRLPARATRVPGAERQPRRLDNRLVRIM